MRDWPFFGLVVKLKPSTVDRFKIFKATKPIFFTVTCIFMRAFELITALSQQDFMGLITNPDSVNDSSWLKTV